MWRRLITRRMGIFDMGQGVYKRFSNLEDFFAARGRGYDLMKVDIMRPLGERFICREWILQPFFIFVMGDVEVSAM